MDQNPLVIQIAKLLGLFTNKTSHHADKDGFLEYQNVENTLDGKRKKRYGSYALYAVNVSSMSTHETAFSEIKDFSFYDKDNNTSKRYFVAATNKRLRIYDGTVWMQDGGSYDLVLESNPETYHGKWSLVPFKNRLLICTQRADYVEYTGASAFPSINVTNGSKIVNCGDSISVSWPKKATIGSILFVDGIPYEVKRSYLAGVAPTNYYLELMTEFTGTTNASETGWRCEYANKTNFYVFDPVDSRNGANPCIYQVGCYTPSAAPTISIDTTSCVYATGTVSVTNGSKTVTGAGTTWDDGGDWDEKYFYGPDGEEYQIKTVDSTTQITIFGEYKGDTATGASYDIYKGNITANVQYTYAYAFYNSKTGHISNYSPVTVFTSNYKAVAVAITGLTIETELVSKTYYDTIIVLRSVDGGVNLYECGRIDTATSSTFSDDKEDRDLGGLPASKFSNGTPPSMLEVEAWGNRLWGVDLYDRSKLWYSGNDAEIPWGRPEECWAATNYLIVPSDSGFVTGIKRAGDFLYVMCDSALYVVNGLSSLTFRLEKIAEIDGGMWSEAMVEVHPKEGRPGLGFITKSRKVVIMSPGWPKPLETQFPIYDELKDISDADWNVGKLHRVKYKDKDYLIVSIAKNSNSHSPSFTGSYVLDQNLGSWYFDTYAYTKITKTLSDLSTSKIVGSYFYTNMINSGPADAVALLDMYDDANDFDYVSSITGKVQAGTRVAAHVKTSWLDFGNKKIQKTLKKIRGYFNVAGFLMTCYREEDASAYITDRAFTKQDVPYTNAKDKEYTSYAIDAAEMDYYTHQVAIKITFPDTAGAEIEMLEIESQADSQDPGEH